MKKILALSIICTMTLAVTACGGASGNTSSSGSSKSSGFSSASPEPSKPEIKPDLYPDTVNIINHFVDGESYHLDWSPANNATYYQIAFDKENPSDLKKCNVNIGSIVPGELNTIYLRSVNDNNESGNTTYSDWIDFDFVIPSANIADFTLIESVSLSPNQLLSYANARGFEVDSSATENGYVYSLHCKDPENSGFLNRLLSGGKAFFQEYVSGYSESVSNDFSSVDKVLENYLDSGSIKDMLKDVHESADDAATEGAILRGLKTAFADTDIYLNYYYDANGINNNHGAEWLEAYYLVNGREDFREKNMANYTPDADGTCHAVSNTYPENKYSFSIGKVISNHLPKWAVVVIPE